MTRFQTALSIVVGGVATISISLAGAFAQPQSGGVLTMVQPIEPPGLVSAVNTSTYLGTVSTKIHEGLVKYDEKFQPQPSLATSWEISPDGLEYTFHLRENVVWHDGEPFTAEDVEFSLLEVWKEIHGRGRTTFEHVTEVDTPDSHTVIFRVAEPSPMIMSALSAYEAQVLPKHIYGGSDIATHPGLNAPVGTGPFKFSEWQKGQYIRLVRNTDYWDQPKPYLDEIVFRIIPDGGARAAALESGEVLLGVFSPVPLADVNRLTSSGNLDALATGYEMLAPMYLMEFNLEKRYMEDRAIRRAIAHAIDKEFIVDNIWFGFGKVATGPLASTSPYYATEGVPQYEFDPELANRILDEAGYEADGGGIRFALTLDTLRDPETLRTAEYIRHALGSVGIDVKIRNSDLGTFIRHVYTEYDFDATLNFFSLLSDPTLGMERIYISSNIREGTPWANASRFRNEEVDSLLESARVENDPEARREQFAKVQEIVQEELPVLNLFEMQFVTVANERVENLSLGGEGPYASFSEIYLQP